MKIAKARRIPSVVVAMAASLSAHASYTSPDGDFSLSGFGTLGAVKNSTNEARLNYPGQGGGAGTTPSLNADTKLAVQGTYKLTPAVSGTVQVMTKFNADGQYVPSIDWAFAKWQASPDLSMRLGRIGAPFFMISDFRDVGYANTPVRPALDVYAQVIFSQFEGGDVSYTHNVGPLTLTSTLWAGNSSDSYALSGYDATAMGPLTGKNTSEPAKVESKNIVGLNFQAEMDNGLSLRLGYSQGQRLSVTANGTTELLATANYLTALSLLPASLSANLSTLMTVKDAKSSFAGIGLTYDTGDWLLTGELTRRKTESYISDTTGYYGMAGYRIGKWTPFLSLSKLKTDHREANPLAALKGDPTGNALYQAAETVLNAQKLDQRTMSMGARYDVKSGLAVKGQWDRITKPADSSGTFFAPSSSFVAERRTVNVLTLSVDFVF